MDAADLIVKIELLEAYIHSLLNTKPIDLQEIDQGLSQRKELLYQLGASVYSSLQQNPADETGLHQEQLTLNFEPEESTAQEPNHTAQTSKSVLKTTPKQRSSAYSLRRSGAFGKLCSRYHSARSAPSRDGGL